MSMIPKRSELSNHNKTYQGTDRVTVLGLVCEKMAERVALPRQEDEDRQEKDVVVGLRRTVEEETRDTEDKEGDEGTLLQTRTRSVRSQT